MYNDNFDDYIENGMEEFDWTLEELLATKVYKAEDEKHGNIVNDTVAICLIKTGIPDMHILHQIFRPDIIRLFPCLDPVNICITIECGLYEPLPADIRSLPEGEIHFRAGCMINWEDKKKISERQGKSRYKQINI